MTIFYVDPVNGSNSNNGTSWGTAWRWLPGNGTAVVPGDEVRFAKSNSYTPAQSASISGTSHGLSALGYSAVVMAATWVVGAGGGTVASGSITFTGGANIPASTKLMYSTQARTVTTGNGMLCMVDMRGVPTGAVGAYLRLAVCSDTLGATPIFYLDGRTIMRDHASNTIRVLFEYNSATTLNFTAGSFALYSVGAFTAPANGARIAVTSWAATTPLQTGTSYIKQGSVYSLNTPRQPIPTPVVDRLDTYQYPGGLSTTSGMSSVVAYSRLTSAASATNHPITVYAPLPDSIYDIHDVTLTYAGTAGSRIKMSGGWNTGSGVQDGYTNMGIGGFAIAPRAAAFNYSSGGQYIDYERFLCHQGTLVGFTYNPGTIATLYLTDCSTTYTSGYASGFIDAAMVSVPSGTASVTVADLRLTRCTTFDWAHVVPGKVGDAVGAFGFYSGATLSFGSVEATDCFLWSWGAFSSYSSHSGSFVVKSSTPGTPRAYFCVSGNVLLRNNMPIMDISDTYIVAPNSAWYGADIAEVATLGVKLKDVYFTMFGGSGAYQSTLELRNMKSVEIDGFLIANPNYPWNAMSHVTIGWLPTWLSSNTPTLKYGGPVGSRASYQYSANFDYFLVYGWPSEIMDVSVGVARALTLHTNGTNYWPSFRVRGRPGLLRVRGVEASSLSGTFTPADVASAYYPNHPEIWFENCVGKVALLDSGPTGSVRMLGGSAPSDTAHELGPYGKTAIAPGAAYYGTTVGTLEDTWINNNSVNSNAQHLGWYRRAVGVDVKGTPLLTSTNVSGSAICGIQSIMHLHPDADVSEVALDDVQNNPTLRRWGHGRGVALRRPDGRFAFKAGSGYAVSSATLNAYGKRDLRVYGGFPLARLDVKAGSSITCVIRVRPTRAETCKDFCRVLVQPCTAYTSTINNHAIQRSYLSTTEDEVISFTFSPQKDGTVPINFYTNVVATIKDFTVSVA